MKVRDIISDTVWTPGSGYSVDHKPAISVLLPTYRRGASGLFRKAVESVLEQTLEDIELIIIDDASTDGTADQIAEFMRKDGRVSCLRHPCNIGLPAISEFEAFTKARADFIAFAFDDDFFYTDALEKLLEHSLKYPNRVCYGNAIWRVPVSGDSRGIVARLGQSLSSLNLRSSNTIANSSILLPRYIIDEIGLYDPNVLMARLCDWDLWRRISERYLLQHIDVDVAEVTGPAQDDSLGRTYPLVSGSCEEWMRAATRDLTPKNYDSIEIFEIPPGMSPHTQAAIADLTEIHCAQRAWLLEGNSNSSSRGSKTVVVLTLDYNASATLCFDYLPKSIRGSVKVISLQSGMKISELASASCLIVVRLIDRYREWIDTAIGWSIPVYYFIDDNLTELAAKENIEMPEDFSISALRSKLSKFHGVMVTTQALEEYFSANLIHGKLFLLPVSYSKKPIAFSTKAEAVGIGEVWRPDLTIASIGGSHRQLGLREKVIPAIQSLVNEGHRIHFVISGSASDHNQLSEIEVNDRLKLTFEPLQLDWNRALLQIAEHRPDVLIHAPSETINNKYKTLNVALCAYLLDALLAVPNSPPYDIPTFDGAAVRVDPPQEPRAWLQALKKITAIRDDWDLYKQINATFCRTHFSGEQSLIVLKEILENASAVSPTLLESRLKEMYFSKTLVNTGGSPDSEPLRMSLHELSALRSRIRRYRRFKPRLSHEDLWPHVSSAFDDIRQYIEESNMRTSNSYLELSDAIQDRAFVEYSIFLKCGTIRSISCAFSSEGIQDGSVGIELVNPAGGIEVQTALALDSTTNLQFPVTFDLKEIVIPQDGTWHLRLFARSKWPIYALEFATYSRLGWTRQVIAPFARVEYAERVQVAKKIIRNQTTGNAQASTTPSAIDRGSA